MASPSSKRRLADIVIGGAIGGVVGAIAAVNFVIYVGIERGYEASLTEVFAQNRIAGFVTVVILLGGPVLGAMVARRIRQRPSRDAETTNPTGVGGRKGR